MCSTQMPLRAALASSSTHMHARMLRSCQGSKPQQHIAIKVMQPSAATHTNPNITSEAPAAMQNRAELPVQQQRTCNSSNVAQNTANKVDELVQKSSMYQIDLCITLQEEFCTQQQQHTVVHLPAPCSQAPSATLARSGTHKVNTAMQQHPTGQQATKEPAVVS